MADSDNCTETCCQNRETKLAVPLLDPLDIIKVKLTKTIDLVTSTYMRQRDHVHKLHSTLLREVIHYRQFYYPVEQPHFPFEFDTKSIMVFNLNNDVQIQDLANHFRVCGPIAEVDLIFEDETRFLGKARITFHEEVHAFIALSMNKSVLLNHPLYVLPWHLDRNIEIIKAMVKEWGRFLLQIYPATATVIDNLRILNAIAQHRYELTCLYLKSRIYNQQRNSKEIDTLIVDAVESLRIVGKYPVSLDECDVDFDRLDKPQFGYPLLGEYMKI